MELALLEVWVMGFNQRRVCEGERREDERMLVPARARSDMLVYIPLALWGTIC